jgi:hypothetical protein
MPHQGLGGGWTSNEFIYKPDLGARGVTEKNTYDAGLDRVDARLGKEIWAGDPKYGNTIAAALTAIGSNPARLRVPAGTWTIDANLTVPANVILKVEQGATLALATAVTLTMNGGLEAGLHRIVTWAGTGKMVFAAASPVKEVFAEWWGAAGDGVADDTAAVTACRDAAVAGNKTLRFLPGRVYAVNGFNMASYLNVIAYGATLLHNGANSPLLSIDGGTGTTVMYSHWRGGILQAKPSATNPTSALVYCHNAWHNTVECEVLQGGDLPGTANRYAGFGIHVYGRPTYSAFYNRFKVGRIYGCVTAGILNDGTDSGANFANSNTYEIARLEYNGVGCHLAGGTDNTFLAGYYSTNNGAGIKHGNLVRGANYLGIWLEGNNGAGNQFDIDTSNPLSVGSNVYQGTLASGTVDCNYWKRLDQGAASYYGGTHNFRGGLDSQQGLAGQSIFSGRVVGDAGNRLDIMANGTINWYDGAGGALGTLSGSANGPYAAGHLTAKSGLITARTTIASSGNIALPDNFAVFYTQLTDNIAFTAFPTGIGTKEIRLELKQAAAGGKTVSFPGTVLLAGGSFTLTAAANKIDVISFAYNSAEGKWVEVARAQNL